MSAPIAKPKVHRHRLALGINRTEGPKRPPSNEHNGVDSPGLTLRSTRERDILNLERALANRPKLPPGRRA